MEMGRRQRGETKEGERKEAGVDMEMRRRQREKGKRQGVTMEMRRREIGERAENTIPTKRT